MRKKLFAVIMSAMMMITFMPTMAFAANQDYKAATEYPGFHISGLANGYVERELSEQDYFAYFYYDGQDHTVTYEPGTSAKQWKKVTYTVAYEPINGTMAAPKEWDTATAPVVKDAGLYLIREKTSYIKGNEDGSVVRTLLLAVAPRPVSVTANTKARTKTYDQKPYVLSEADFTIGTYAGEIKIGTGHYHWNYVQTGKTVIDLSKLFRGFGPKASGNLGRITIKDYEKVYEEVMRDYWDWNEMTAAFRTAHSGLVGSDKLIAKEVKTTVADAGKYTLALTESDLNTNYFVVGTTEAKFDVEITKADNVAKIASNTITVKRGASKPVKFSTTFGTAKLEKVSTGNTKIQVKNGKVVVKKNCKKGTYKITVKCSATGNANYASASRQKVLKIKVK